MSNASITIDQFNDLLSRVDKLEHRETVVDIDELKGSYYKIEKDVAVTDTKIDATKVELKQEINALRVEINEKFNSLEKRFTMLWALQIVTFLAILGLYLKGIVI